MVNKILPLAAAASPLAIASLLWVFGSSRSGLEAVSRLVILSAGLILLGIALSVVALMRSGSVRDRVLSLVGVFGNIGLAVLAAMQSRPS
jgi:hypothetical protein